MFQVKVTVKSTTAGKPCSKFKVGDSWIVDWLKITPGMCSRVAIEVTFLASMQAAMQLPDNTIMELSCPSCQNANTVMTYEVKKLPAKNPIEPIPHPPAK